MSEPCQNPLKKATLNRFVIPGDLASRRICFLGALMDALTMADTMRLIEQAMRERQALQHVVVNVAKLVAMQTDEALYRDVTASDLINIDGMGVVWGCRMMGLNIPERVSGTDIMEHTVALCAQHGYRPFILGAKEPIILQAIENLAARYPGVQFAGHQHGYYDRATEQAVMEHIRDSGADCLFIAMPSPHKERILAQYREMLGIPFIMGVGGSVDVFAGHVSRAPLWMQNAGLEWLHRLLQEPRKMFRRYATTNSAYALLLLKARLGFYQKPPFVKSSS